MSKPALPEGHHGEPVVFGAPEAIQSPRALNSDVSAPVTPYAAFKTSLAGIASRISIHTFFSHDTGEAESQEAASMELSINLDPEMRRATRLSIALTNFGCHWKRSSDGDHELSEKIIPDEADMVFDAFISHDWHTSRWLKVGTLILVFNLRAASYAGFGASIVFSVFEHWLRKSDCSRLLSVGATDVCSSKCVWSYPASVAVYFVVLCFWQRFKSAILHRPTMIFFDKLCIEQKDEDKKKKGIRHLAGFLKHSNKLVVLWSPIYFSRLWCTFELAAWKHLGKYLKRDPPQVLPVKLVVVVLLYMGAWFAQLTPALFMPGSTLSLFIWILLCFFLSIPYVFWAGQVASELKKLPAQIRGFKIKESKCFCCTNEHEFPETKEPIPCDRLLVYKALQSWYTSDPENTGASCAAELGSESTLEEIENNMEPVLKWFDDHVSQSLYGNFTEAIRGSKALYEICVRSAGVVYWCFACTNFLGNLLELILKLDWLSSLRLVLEPLQVTFLVIPTGFLCTMKIAAVGARFATIPQFLKVFLQASMVCVVHMVCWIPVWLTRRMESLIPQVVFMFHLMMVTIWVFVHYKGVD